MSATDPVQAVREIGREHRPAKVNSVEGTLTCACGHVSAEWDGLELHRAELTIAAVRPAIEREAKAAALIDAAAWLHDLPWEPGQANRGPTDDPEEWMRGASDGVEWAVARLSERADRIEREGQS